MNNVQLNLEALPMDERIAMYRKMADEGTITKEQMIIAVQWIRGLREKGIQVNKAKKKKVEVDSNQLLADLEAGLL